MYIKVWKRFLDLVLSLAGIILLSPLFLVLTAAGAVMMKGNPFFAQPRPGKDEKIFRLVKFRTMSNAKGPDGKLLPDEQRLNGYGKFLRASSLDELPELVLVAAGKMALVGPRPQLVRDMVFMNKEIRRRHTVRPGLTGLAQVNGRNAVTWEKKFEWDLKYIEQISFRMDLEIVGETVRKVFGREESSEELEVADDYGDALLNAGKISREEYDLLQQRAKKLLDEFEEKRGSH